MNKWEQHYDFIFDILKCNCYDDKKNCIHNLETKNKTILSYILYYLFQYRKNTLIETLSLKYNLLTGFIQKKSNKFNMFISLKPSGIINKKVNDIYLQNYNNNIHEYIKEKEIENNGIEILSCDKQYSFFNTVYNIYDLQKKLIAYISSRNKKEYTLYLDNKEICVFVVESYEFDTNKCFNPIKVNVLIPGSSIKSSKIKKEWDQQNNILKFSHQEQNKIVNEYINEPAVWDRKLGYIIEFDNKIDVKPFSRNIKIIDKSSDNYGRTIFEFVKHNKKELYNFEMATPFSPLISFALIITLLDCRI